MLTRVQALRMALNPAMGKRLVEARLQTGARQQRPISQEEMAALVAKGLGKPLNQTQWSRYENGREPPYAVLLVVAQLSGLTAAYLAFGPEEHAPMTEPLQPADAPEREAAAKKKRRRA